MTTLTSPDNLVKWDTSDPVSIVAPIAQLADSVQEALLERAAKSYVWANKAARDAQTGMSAGHTGFQSDISMFWYYDGTRWNPMTTSTFASLSAVTTQIPSPATGMIVNIGGVMFRYSGSAWRQATSGLVPIVPTLASAVTGVSVDTYGKITFTSATGSPVFNNAFVSDFDNYLIKFQLTNNNSGAPASLRLTKAGTASSAGYDWQRTGMSATATALNDQTLNDSGFLMSISASANTVKAIGQIEVFDPADATQPTGLLMQVGTTLNPMAATTSSSTGMRFAQHRTLDTYDGFQIIPAASVSGTIRVYAYADMD